MRLLFAIWILLRRIVNQWRLELCLFLGLLVAMAVVVAVPLYTNSVLQESFIKDMQTSFRDKPPFTYTVSISDKPWGTKPLTKQRLLAGFQLLQQCPVPARMGIPLICSGWSAMTADVLEIPDPQKTAAYETSLQVLTMTGLESLVTFEEGRAPKAKAEPDGTVEMVCAVSAADKMGMIVGKSYSMNSTLLAEKTTSTTADDEPVPTTDINFRLTGTFHLRKDRLNALGWITSPDFSVAVFVNPDAFINEMITRRGMAITNLDMTWIMDYRKARVQDLPRLTGVINDLGRGFSGFDKSIEVVSTPLEVFDRFSEKKNMLQLQMLALALPTLLLVIYYILLMAGLIVDQRRGEIAMLRSRGAGSFQLVGMFLMEWTVLGVCCLVAGPPLGLFLAQIVGASAGFLNFVNRKALSIGMTNEAYLYGLILTVIMIAAATIPAAKACRSTIIQHKQDRSRNGAQPIWQRFYLDFLLLGIGAYGYRLMRIQAEAADQSSAVLEKAIDPLLFLVPVLIVIGGGLLVVRVLPLITGLLEKIISRWKGVAVYASLVEISRNMAGFRPIILLVILTTATGIYSAALARTLEKNTRDRICYAAGSDLVIKESWYRLIRDPNGWGFILDKDHPFEPPFAMHRNLPGVLSVARVQLNEGVQVSGNNFARSMNVMAVDPYDFGHTTWFRPGLTPLHLVNYLNLLTQYPQGVFVSGSLIKNGFLKIGDTLTTRMNRGVIDWVVAGGLDYWPTLYENDKTFLIANLDYVTAQTGIRPYNIWMRLKPAAKVSPIMEALSRQSILATPVKDTRNELILARRDPRQMGLYGIMSIGFCIAVLVTVIGYVLYTFISLQKRLLQFGVMRAMGLSLRQLIGILGLEQLWSAGIGLAMGTLIGQTISWFFVPFLRTATAMTGKIPPFQVIISGIDIITIYSILLPILILALTGLAFSLARQQIHQAVKLGEES
jgi:putative ABC transport system permease protein